MDPREAQMNKALMKEIKAKKAAMKEMEEKMNKSKPKDEDDSINDREWKQFWTTKFANLNL